MVATDGNDYSLYYEQKSLIHGKEVIDKWRFEILNDTIVELSSAKVYSSDTINVPATIEWENKTYVVKSLDEFFCLRTDEGGYVVNLPSTVEVVKGFSGIKVMNFAAAPKMVLNCGDWYGAMFREKSIPTQIGTYKIKQLKYRSDLSEELLLAMDVTGKLGIIDYAGNVLIPFEYDEFDDENISFESESLKSQSMAWDDDYCFSSMHYYIFKKGDYWGAVDLKNNVLVPFKKKTSYDVWKKRKKMANLMENKFAEEQYEIDSLRKCQINVAYLMYCAEESVRREEKRQRELARQDSIRRVAEEKRQRELAHQDSIAPVLAKGPNGLWGIVEKKTRKKITPYQYENVKPVQETGWGAQDTLFYIVQKKGKKGVFSIKQRKECIQPVFDDISALSMSAGVSISYS